MSFGTQLTSFSLRLKSKSKETVRQIAFQGLKMLAENTPVDTGRARNNWFLSAYSPSGEINDSFSKSVDSGRMIAEIGKITGNEGVIYISNNLKYIMALENGHSQQKPSGFVAISLKQLKQYIESGKLR